MRPKKEPQSVQTETGIAARLARRFGLGANAEARLGLYRRLELAVEVHGERAYVQLQTVAAEAAGKRKPDRYFCRAALCRMREAGLLEREEF